LKIAVTYENGEVFQHFGHTEQFKVYEVENDQVVSSEIIGTDGNGHEALAAFLADKGVNAIICGGMGAGAQQALAQSGIAICAGATGDADAAVAAFLRGELVDTGVNCDHHHEEEEGGCGGHCGGGCGGCGGGCHSAPMFEGKNVGKTVKVHYRGTLNDGSQFDSSYDRNEPLEFVCGMGMMIYGFDAAVAELEVGQSVDVHLMPEEAYGEADPKAIFTIPVAELPGCEELVGGENVILYDNMGSPIRVKVVSKDDVNITFDANHEMAGKELNFHIELVSVED